VTPTARAEIAHMFNEADDLISEFDDSDEEPMSRVS